jgi:hypothetical protein
MYPYYAFITMCENKASPYIQGTTTKTLAVLED